MESKEILKEFAGKLAGLSAAAKVVAIAGAVSAYSGTGHAAAESAVKAENRIVTVAKPNEKKSEEVSAKKEEPAKTQVSEASVKALLASKEKDVAKASDTKVTAVAKANVSPKNESKTAPKYDTRYYQAPGTTKPTDRTSRPARSSYRSSPSYSSSYDYNYNSAPTAPSYATSTSDDDTFGETASSSRRSSRYSLASRRPYASGSYRPSRSRSTETDEMRSTDIGKSLAGGKKGSDAESTASSSSKSGQSALNSSQGFGFGDTQVAYKDRVVEKVVNSEEAEEALKIVQAAKEKGLNAEALAEKIQNFEQDNTQIGSDADAEKIHALEHELQVERTQNANLRQQVQQAANANAQPQIQPVDRPAQNAQPVAQPMPNVPQPAEVGVQPVAPAQAIVPVNPAANNNIGAIPPVVPNANPNLQVHEGQGAGIPPPPGVAGTNGIPLPPGVPPPPPGVPPPPPGVPPPPPGVPPPPPGVPNAPVFVAPVIVEPDFDAFFNEVAAKADAALAKEQAERDAKIARAAEEAVNLFAATQGVLEKFKNPPAKFDKDNELTRLRDRFARVATTGHRKMDPQAFYACCLAVFGEARKALNMPEESDERMIFEEAFRAAAAEILLSIAYAGDTDENRKAFVDCCETYAVEFSRVRRATKNPPFTQVETAKCMEALAKCGDVAGAVADQPAVAANQCSALDKAIFSNLEVTVRSEGWYKDDELAALIEKQKKVIAGMDPKTKKMPEDLNDAKKDEIKKLLLKLNSMN